jgi:hypothetical protein
MKSPLDKLIALMAQERAALRSGDAHRVGALATTKARLIDLVEGDTPKFSATQIERLRSEAARTATVLAAALDGLRQARADVANLRDRDERVYQRDGTRDPMGVARPTLARRA